MTYGKENEKPKQPGVALAMVRASRQTATVGLHTRQHMAMMEAKVWEGLRLTLL